MFLIIEINISYSYIYIIILYYFNKKNSGIEKKTSKKNGSWPGSSLCMTPRGQCLYCAWLRRPHSLLCMTAGQNSHCAWLPGPGCLTVHDSIGQNQTHWANTITVHNSLNQDLCCAWLHGLGSSMSMKTPKNMPWMRARIITVHDSWLPVESCTVNIFS